MYTWAHGRKDEASKLHARLLRFCKRFVLPERKKGQGLVEYTCVIAFVCLMVALVFSFSSGTLFAALSQSHSRIVSEFDRINNETAKYGQ